MKVEDMANRPLVPVAWKHLWEVRALLEHLEARDSARTDDAEDSRAEILRVIFDSCSMSTQRMLLYMAEEAVERPGKPFLGEELAKAADAEGTTNISPYIKSVNSAAKKLGIDWEHRLVRAYRRPDRLFLFEMSPEDAEIVRGFAD